MKSKLLELREICTAHSEWMTSIRSVNITSEATEEVYLIIGQMYLVLFYWKVSSYSSCTFPWKWRYKFNRTGLNIKQTTYSKLYYKTIW